MLEIQKCNEKYVCKIMYIKNSFYDYLLYKINKKGEIFDTE